MTRPEQLISPDVLDALTAGRVINEFNDRPRSQRSEYLQWIADGEDAAARSSRIEQLVHELGEGGVFLGMPHPASRKEHHREPPPSDPGDPL